MSSSSLSSPEQCGGFPVPPGVKSASAPSRQPGAGAAVEPELRKKRRQEAQKMALKRNCELFTSI